MKKSEHDRWLRDLRWAIRSPYLMSPVGSGQDGFTVDLVIGAGEIREEELEPLLAKYRGHRVGYYFESLIGYWLKHIRRVEILAQGFQIVVAGRTLGELDFVFRDEQGRVIHWEVAAKFYLYCEDQKVKGSRFIGPNAQDTFELKREKIFGKQLLLSEKAFPEVSLRQAFVKGRIFYHPEAKEPEDLPLGMMPDHLRGVWIRHAELSWLERQGGSKKMSFHLIEKPYWLAAECLTVSDSSPLTLRDLREHLDAHFSKQNQPILISVLVQSGKVWQESCRVFVVADDWPKI